MKRVSTDVKSEEAQEVRRLLSQGEAPDARSMSGVTALMRAALHGHEPAVLALLEAGANPNQTDTTDGRTALHYAAHKGHLACALRLLGHKEADLVSGKLHTAALARCTLISQGWR